MMGVSVICLLFPPRLERKKTCEEEQRAERAATWNDAERRAISPLRPVLDFFLFSILHSLPMLLSLSCF